MNVAAPRVACEGGRYPVGWNMRGEEYGNPRSWKSERTTDRFVASLKPWAAAPFPCRPVYFLREFPYRLYRVVHTWR